MSHHGPSQPANPAPAPTGGTYSPYMAPQHGHGGHGNGHGHAHGGGLMSGVKDFFRPTNVKMGCFCLGLLVGMCMCCTLSTVSALLV